jgi:ABC-type transport system involved in Fe-S cluster assembly fused permease/ATPase subunit
MADLSTVASLLDYLYPICMFLTFVSVVIFDWFTLRTANTSEKASRGRRTALTLSFVIFLTYAGQVIMNLVQALRHRTWVIPEHRIIGTLGNMYIWGVLIGALVTLDKPVWDPFLTSWMLGLAFEITLCSVAAPRLNEGTAFDIVRVAMQGVRISALVILNLNIFRTHSRSKKADLEGENEPLLNGHANGLASQTAEYGAAKVVGEDVGGVENDPDKDLKESQRKRLEAHGGWWGYIKEFKIFIPYLVPFKNRKVQLCVVIIIINMVLGRFVNVMVPRQMGIITDMLAKNSSIMPWKAVLVWVVLRWANSFASFGLISDIAHTHLHNWSSSQIKQLAFRHVLALSMDFHSNKDSGDLIKSIGQADSLNDLLETIFFQILPILLDVFIAFAYISHLFNGAMAMVFVMVGSMFIWTSITTTTRVRPKRRVYTEKSRAESKTMYECVSNWPTISYFNRTTYEEQRYGQAVKEEMNAQLRYYIMNSLGYAVQYLIIYGGLLTVSMMAIFQISEGRKPIGNFVTLVMYWSSMMSPLHMITYQYRRISGATVDAERLLQLLQTEPTVKNNPNARPLIAGDGKVVFKDVGFSYDERKTTLDNLNFTVQPGQTVAFVGETGGGKSTTLKLLFRFYDVKDGSISIDGQDLRDVTLESLRQKLGVVPQDPSLFNQTIMENVRYARLDAKDEEVIEACKAAAVHEKIMSFPDQYQSKVGERGVKLSGGELQRVAIARVILKNPKIVLLDEATSAVDSSIEAQIQAAFKKLSTGRTTFVVAHRLSTIMEADLIIVIDQGKIIERGTHEELVTQGTKYFELWSKQTAGKGSNVASEESSVLEVPEDVNPAPRSEPSPPTSKAEGQKASVNAEDGEEVPLIQLDGACESRPTKKGEETSCFGLKKKKKSKRDGNQASFDSDSASASDNGDDPIRMVSARPTTGTTASIPQERTSQPRGTFEGQSLASRKNTDEGPNSMIVEPSESRKNSSARGPSSGPTPTSSSVSNLAVPLRIPKVTVESPKTSLSSAAKSSNENNTKPEPVEHKTVQGRKPTGYPKDMPGGKGDETSSSAASVSSLAAYQIPIELARAAPSFQDEGIRAPLSTPLSGIGPRFDSARPTRRSTEGTLAVVDPGAEYEEEIKGGVERFDTALED